MIILREYKSVAFWLTFVSLWIIGWCPCCNEEKENGSGKDENTSENNVNNKNNKEIKGNYNSNTNNKNSSNKLNTNKIRNENKKPNGYTNINNNDNNNIIKDKIINPTKKDVNNTRINNKKPVQAANTGSNSNMNNNNGNMNRILFQNQNNQVYAQNLNQKVTFNQGQNIKNSIKNQINNNNKAVANIGLGSIQSMNSMNMNPNQINNNFNNNKQAVPANMVSKFNQNMNDKNMNLYQNQQNIPLVNDAMQNKLVYSQNPNSNITQNEIVNKVQNMNPNQINNNKMMNNFVQNNNNLVYSKNQNQNPNQISYQGQIINPNLFYNQGYNNNQQVQANMGSNMNMNNPQMNVNMNSFPQNMHMMNNPMQNNNNLVYPQNQNQNQISYQGQFITQNLNQNQNFINILPPPPAPKKPEPISTYTKPTLIGLNNIGSTCYKNAVLACLSQTKDLTNYFLKEENYNKIINNNIAKKNPGTKTLCPIYYNLIKNLWKKNATFKSFSPDEFMNSITEMTKNDQVNFSLYEAGDAKDFVIYILEKMHAELKQPIKNKFWNLGPNDKLNQYDKNNAFLFFLDEFQNDTSIVSDLFFGFNETTNVCQFCKNKYNSNGQIEPICYNYGIFNTLIFPLEEVRKYREQMMRMTNTNINIGAMANVVSLFECFFYNQKSDFFTGDNKNYCNICRQLFDSVYTSKITVSPNILVLILNRGKGNVFNIKLDFSLQIDITDFVLTKSQNREIYNLYGVITHLGQSGPNAHFVAACKSPVDGNWYRYNDAIVTPINNFQNDIYNFGTPYILFYEKQK